MIYSHEALRHSLATLAYRASKAVRGAPASFADFGTAGGARTPVQILAHLGDLMDWGLALSQGKSVWHDSPPLPWDREVARFFAAVTAWDAFLATGAPLGRPPERMFQGAIADALNHVGQINLLRRQAGAPIRGENYHQAAIAVGRTGLEQTPPDAKNEFD